MHKVSCQIFRLLIIYWMNTDLLHAKHPPEGLTVKKRECQAGILPTQTYNLGKCPFSNADCLCIHLTAYGDSCKHFP